MARLTSLKPSLGSLAPLISTGRDSAGHSQTAEPWRSWYKTGRWLKLRAQQLRTERLCRMCMARKRYTPARVCDHIEPHRGDPHKFWAGPFQSLCIDCHNGMKQREEKRART